MAISSEQEIPRYKELVFLGSKWAESVYHTMVEHFPRLVVIRDFLLENPDIHILGSTRLRSYVELLGLDPGRIVSHEQAYGDLIYVPEPSQCGHLQPVVARAAQRLIREVVEKPKKLQNIVVVRRSHHRALVNHEELMTALQAALPGERFVEFSEANMPPAGREQYDVFAHAKVVIAPHGAALSNILACPSSTAIVEFLAHGDDFNICYLSLASVLNLEYHPVTMEPVSYSHYQVEVTHVVNIVAEVVKRQHEKGLDA
jgi:capsular polysaccharide biosynthesis protein